MSKKPDIETFRSELRKQGGNLSKTAAQFNVARKTVYEWAKADKAFDDAIKDERGYFLDECLTSARVLALGVGEYENVYDEKLGREVRRLVGWKNLPDGNMLRFLIARLGAKEGFGDYQRPNDDPADDSKRIESIEINVTYNNKEDLELQQRMKKKDEGKA